MRHVLRAFVILFACASLASAGSGQNPSSGSITGGGGGACPTAGKVTLFGAANTFAPVASVTTTTTGATAGLYACSLVQAPCTGSFTKIGCRVMTGLTSSVSECGVYTATGGSRIASTGAVATTASTNILTTGLSAFTLTSGVNYLVCWASSAAATVVYSGTTPGTAFNNLIANTVFNSGAGATQVAPFNAACSASLTPYTCCTGNGTGTCLGMVDRTGVPGIVAASVSGPVVIVGP
jgi:hypothetical protein